MNKIVFIVLLAFFLAPAALAVCAGGSDQLIMRISSPSNAHAELWNGAGNYSTEICYDAIFGVAYPSSGTEHNFAAIPANMNGTNCPLQLSATTNAHVEMTGMPNYPINACFGDLDCDIVAPTPAGIQRPCSIFDPWSECIATISDTANAHISSACSGAGSYLFRVCCVSAASLNTVPVAVAGVDQSVFSVAVVSLDGSGSSDFEDCPGGDLLGTCLNYSWSCDGASPDPCPVLSDSTNYQPSFTSGLVGEVYIFELVVDDGDLTSVPDTVSITVLSSGPDPYLKITLFSVDPLNFQDGAILDFTKLDVRVKNYGAVVNNARMVAEVRDPVTNQPLTVPVSASVVVGIASGGENTQDFESLDISALPAGAYKLVAEVYNDDVGPPELHDSEAVFFTIIRPVAVPELDIVFIPLLALSVLAVLFFAGKNDF